MPVAHVTTLTPVALMIGSNRIVRGNGIIHPLGDLNLSTEAEKKLRRTIIDTAIEALRTDLTEQHVF